MVYLQYGTASTCVFTLKEKSVFCNSYYTFKITNKDTFSEYIFYAPNTSTSKYYDEFSFFIGNTSSATSSIISGATAGIVNAPASQYVYEIYEMLEPYQLGLTNSIKIVETGIWQITGTHTPIPEYKQLNTPTSVYRNKDRM